MYLKASVNSVLYKQVITGFTCLILCTFKKNKYKLWF